MTVAEVIRAFEAEGIQLWLDGDHVRWRRRGRVPLALLAAAREHRDALRTYLARRCHACGHTRPIMLTMDADGAPWWICARCYRGEPNATRSRM